MRTARRLGLATVTALVLAAVPPARAQRAERFVFTPYVGAYVPTADLGSAGSWFDGPARQKNAAVFGATVGFWAIDRLGIEGDWAYSGSDITGWKLVTASRLLASSSSNGDLSLSSVRLMTRLLPSKSRVNLELALGPAIINRSGPAYDIGTGVLAPRLTGLMSHGVAMSLRGRVRVGSDVDVSVRADDYRYSADLGYSNVFPPYDGAHLGPMPQNDFVLSLGLLFSLGRHD